nr:hypothetical protein [Allomuricauda sp.]
MKKKIALYTLMGFAILLGCSKDSGTTPPDDNIDRTPNLQATGSSANDILSNDNYDRILFEIAYVEGFRPQPGTIANFENFIRERTFKSNFVFDYKSIPSPNKESLTIEEIDDLEQENRTAYNDGTILAVYIFFSDAPSDGDDLDEGLVTLGAVYRNTSMVIYESTIRDLASQSNFVTVTEIETSTLHHEFGHLMGLVDLGTEQVNEHEDPSAPNHCNVSGCLMRAELEFGGPTMKILESNVSKGLAAIPQLGPQCILDLQNNGGR